MLHLQPHVLEQAPAATSRFGNRIVAQLRLWRHSSGLLGELEEEEEEDDAAGEVGESGSDGPREGGTAEAITSIGGLAMAPLRTLQQQLQVVSAPIRVLTELAVWSAQLAEEELFRQLTEEATQARRTADQRCLVASDELDSEHQQQAREWKMLLQQQAKS